MNRNALPYTLALSQVPGVGSVIGKQLITHFGDAESVFRRCDELRQSRPVLADAIQHASADSELWRRTEAEMKFIDKYNLSVLFFQDTDYPYRLADCYDSPLYIFYKGNTELNAAKIIGIVGTRSATDYGKTFTRELVGGLKEDNPVIVSGLAYGIDSQAHMAALDNGLDTIGVLGHGLDRIYPFNNKAMAEKMLGQGGLVTEFFSCTEPDRENFPQRNRIIAGLCDAIIVIEAAEEGGALITADIAHSYNRDVFAVPGRTTDLYSGGCNLLLRYKKADAVRNAGDLISEMGWREAEVKAVVLQPKLFIPLSPEEEKIMELMRTEGELTIDEICRKTGLAVNKISVAMLNLELENVVRCKPGKLFTLSPAQAR
ncbi:MAG: DNA-processing protein DprA [Bacteroidetes bacterium]|nr:DNA-processing protein DprA [Bacteroidota bacterium]